MVKRWAAFAALVATTYLAATAEVALLAWIVSRLAIDQPSLALLVSQWGQQWALLLASCTAACLLIRPAAGRRGVLRQVGLIALVCALSLALCLLAGGLAALLEKLELTRVFTSIPNRARQASAEVMLAMAERSGLPLAGFMIFLSLRTLKPSLGRQAIAASAPPADHPSFPS